MRQVHLEACGIFNQLCVDEDLVWFAEVEGELILVHELPVLLGALAAHGGLKRAWVLVAAKSEDGGPRAKGEEKQG